MTRKLTRKAHTFRSFARSLAPLAVLMAVATLAQMSGTRQLTKSHDAPTPGNAEMRLGASTLAPGMPLFLPAVSYGSGGFIAQSVAVGDVNGDGIPDLLVGNACINHDCNFGTVSVLLGVGDGTFRDVGSYGTQGEGAIVAVGDLNGDGTLDLVAADFCNVFDCSTGVVTVRTGNEDGTFAGGTYVFKTGGQSPSSIALADVNGDGKLDLVVTDCGNGCQTGMGTVAVLLGNGDATFQTAVTYDTGGVGAASVAVADVNGDGKPDLVVANECASSGSCPIGPGSVAVLLGKGDGTFQSAVTYSSGGNDAFSIAVADVNGDGKLDVLVANFCGNTNCSMPGTLGVLLGNGDGTFQPVIPYSLGGPSLGQIVLADVNGDGKLDIVTASQENAMVLLGNGDGTFQTPVGFFPTGGFGAAGIAVADVNGDGRPDVMVTNRCFNSNPNCNFGSVGVLLNNTGPHSPTRTSLVSNVNPAAINQLVIYTATVVNQSGGRLTGTVAFKHNTTTTTVPLVGNQAIYKVTYSGSGAHLVTATYSGDADNATSTSQTLTEYVGLVPTHTILTTSGSPSHVGQAVTFTATVTWTYGTVPDGEAVTFFDGTTILGTGTTAGGVATFTTSSLTLRTHAIKASYAGDATFKPSSGTVAQIVNATSTALASSLNPSIYGQKITWTATVTSSGSTTPTGKVNFTWGGHGIGTATLNASGVASLARADLNATSYPLTAVYLGDATRVGSTSAVLNQVVEQTTSAATISSSLNPSTQGQPVTFTATITSPTVIPKGPVTFTAGKTVLGTAQLSGGKATLTTSSLPVGSTTITVTYAGSSNIAKSSASVTQTVQQ